MEEPSQDQEPSQDPDPASNEARMDLDLCQNANIELVWRFRCDPNNITGCSSLHCFNVQDPPTSTKDRVLHAEDFVSLAAWRTHNRRCSAGVSGEAFCPYSVCLTQVDGPGPTCCWQWFWIPTSCWVNLKSMCDCLHGAWTGSVGLRYQFRCPLLVSQCSCSVCGRWRSTLKPRSSWSSGGRAESRSQTPLSLSVKPSLKCYCFVSCFHSQATIWQDMIILIVLSVFSQITTSPKTTISYILPKFLVILLKSVFLIKWWELVAQNWQSLKLQSH